MTTGTAGLRKRISLKLEARRDLVLFAVPFALLTLLASLADLNGVIGALAERYSSGLFVEVLFGLFGAAMLSTVRLVRRQQRLQHERVAREVAEAEARRRALTDSLTGLANRPALIAAIEEAARRCAPDEQVSVLTLDLDRFKPINETFGHAAGDTTLQVIARRLRAAVENGIVGRSSGDEFVCVLRHADNSNEIEPLAEALLAAVRRPIQLQSGMVELTGSIGIATCRPAACRAEAMLRAADFALQRSKRNRHSAYSIFVPEMEAEMRARATLEIDMRSGIHRNEFLPYFQPIVDLADDSIIGFECLARWQHPTRGLVPPDLFIPLAEEAGMIQDLSFAILRRACIEARKWPRHMTLSVNISPLQLNDSWLPERILQVLCTTGFPPQRLIVEITESRLFADIDTARAILESLKNAGVKIALDDFGTGYASLKHLRELGFNRIKIDRSFVQRLDEAENAQIVRAILRLCEGLHLPVTAEGIEAREIATRLAEFGCANGQGYFFSRPLTAEAALAAAQAGLSLPDAPVRRGNRLDATLIRAPQLLNRGNLHVIG